MPRSLGPAHSQEPIVITPPAPAPAPVQIQAPPAAPPAEKGNAPVAVRVPPPRTEFHYWELCLLLGMVDGEREKLLDDAGSEMEIFDHRFHLFCAGIPIETHQHRLHLLLRTLLFLEVPAIDVRIDVAVELGGFYQLVDGEIVADRDLQGLGGNATEQ